MAKCLYFICQFYNDAPPEEKKRGRVGEEKQAESTCFSFYSNTIYCIIKDVCRSCRALFALSPAQPFLITETLPISQVDRVPIFCCCRATSLLCPTLFQPFRYFSFVRCASHDRCFCSHQIILFCYNCACHSPFLHGLSLKCFVTRNDVHDFTECQPRSLYKIFSLGSFFNSLWPTWYSFSCPTRPFLFCIGFCSTQITLKYPLTDTE